METHQGYQSGAGSPYAYLGMGANGAGIQSSSYYNEELLHKVQSCGVCVCVRDRAKKQQQKKNETT